VILDIIATQDLFISYLLFAFSVERMTTNNMRVTNESIILFTIKPLLPIIEQTITIFKYSNGMLHTEKVNVET
jgi:hypothetical protein